MLTIQLKIDKPINQKNYDEIRFKLDPTVLQCVCGAIGEFIWHGSYKRKVVLTGGDVIPLRIARLYCKHCHHTHAIILSTMVPYSKYPLSVQADIIESHDKNVSLNSILEKYPGIELDTLKSIIKKFHRHWNERLRSIGLALYPLSHLIEESFKHFKCQFMQIKATRNKLIPSPT